MIDEYWDKLKNMMRAHLDGIYVFTHRVNCNSLLDDIFNHCLELSALPEQPVGCDGIDTLIKQMEERKSSGDLTDFGVLRNATIDTLVYMVRDWWKGRATEREIVGWQPIETAPKDGHEILLYACGDIGVCYWRDDEVMTAWTWGRGKQFLNPSHWMPLPDRPNPTHTESEKP